MIIGKSGLWREEIPGSATNTSSCLSLLEASWFSSTPCFTNQKYPADISVPTLINNR